MPGLLRSARGHNPPARRRDARAVGGQGGLCARFRTCPGGLSGLKWASRYRPIRLTSALFVDSFQHPLPAGLFEREPLGSRRFIWEWGGCKAEASSDRGVGEMRANRWTAASKWRPTCRCMSSQQGRRERVVRAHALAGQGGCVGSAGDGRSSHPEPAVPGVFLPLSGDLAALAWVTDLTRTKPSGRPSICLARATRVTARMVRLACAHPCWAGGAHWGAAFHRIPESRGPLSRGGGCRCRR